MGGAALGFQVGIGQPITRTVVVGEIHFGRIGDAVAGSDVVTDTPSLIQLRRQAGETAPAAVSIGCGRGFVAGMTVGIQLLRRHFGVVVTDADTAGKHIVPLDLVGQRETVVGGFHRMLDGAGSAGNTAAEVIIVAV